MPSRRQLPLSRSHAIKMDIGVGDCRRKSKNFKYPFQKTAIPGHGCPGKAWLSQDGESILIASLSHKFILRILRSSLFRILKQNADIHFFACPLKFAVVYCSWERNNVSDITHTGKIHYTSFKTETKARMSCRTVLSKVKVEVVIFCL